MSYFYKTPNNPPKLWSRVVEPFDDYKHDKMVNALYHYRVAGRCLWVLDRPYKKDRYKSAPGFLVQYVVDLQTIYEKPKKVKKAPLVKPPWNAGTKGRNHIYL